MSFRLFSLFFCLLTSFFLGAQEEESNLFEDLLIVDYWNKQQNETFPVFYDHLLQGGYFAMPSARMGQTGEVGVGYGYLHPYIHYNVRVQLANFLEISAAYRVFKGVEDPVLTSLGFGDFSDKGANIKLAVFSPEDSHYQLPGLAFGLEDFVGTSAFKAYYFVLTQVFLKHNLEISLGYGFNRIQGFFGGMMWFPFRRSVFNWLHDMAFIAEYDAIPYHKKKWEPHPKGHVKNTPWQIGMKYRFLDRFDLSLAYVKGDNVAFTLSTFYNFGDCKGFLPKLHDTAPYKSPLNLQPVGQFRSEKELVDDLIFAMRGQGFNVSSAFIFSEEDKKGLRLVISNLHYKEENMVRERLDSLLSSLIPDNIEEVIITVETFGLPIQEYHYKTEYLRLFQNKQIGKYELAILTPLTEASTPNPFTSCLLYEEKNEWWNMELYPKTKTLFGSSRGKFKFALGVDLGFNGFIPGDLFYAINFGYFFFSDIKGLKPYDRLNPSQIINVRSDGIRYFRPKELTIDQAYIEKSWNLGKGWYTRCSLGYFEPMYGGVSWEGVYYPVNSAWALGFDLAFVKKRKPTGLGFTDSVRLMKGRKTYYKKYSGSHCFLNAYYNWKETNLEFKTSVGKFLAHDYGARFEVSRYFPSGLQLGCWYTRTNGGDIINNQTYYDKGIFFSIPLDIFYTYTTRSRWGNGMSAWLRDVGASVYTGTPLYQTINLERQEHLCTK